jgi:hypothetical protein
LEKDLMDGWIIGSNDRGETGQPDLSDFAGRKKDHSGKEFGTRPGRG